jgi:N-methylhydantoinase B
VRTPQEREGDFAAQVMANLTGVERSKQLVAKYGLQQTCDYAGYLNDYAEKMLRQTIAAIPNGEYQFADFLDSDGISAEPVPLKLKLTISGDAAELDFRDCAPQVKGSVNAVFAITLSAVLYCFRCLIKEDVPTNAGIARPLRILSKAGTVVDAQFPAPVAGGNVETSQRIVDLVLGALAQAIPEQIPAASQGTMNNTTIGGIDPRTLQPFSYYETLAGGCGATSRQDGASAVHSHMTNTLNTPVEALEYAYPFRVTRYSLRDESGGKGRQRGGDGLVREIEMLTDTEVTLLSERRTTRPCGLAGGGAGRPGRNLKFCAEKQEELPGKLTSRFLAGERLRIETPGGGGWGGEEV